MSISQTSSPPFHGVVQLGQCSVRHFPIQSLQELTHTPLVLVKVMTVKTGFMGVLAKAAPCCKLLAAILPRKSYLFFVLFLNVNDIWLLEGTLSA